MKRIIYIIILAVLISQPLFADESSQLLSKGYGFDWEKSGPFEFIELLKMKDNVPWYFIVNAGNPPCENGSMVSCSFQAWQYSIVEVHKNWISIGDIPKLIELLNDDTPCASVSMAISSLISHDASTVGHEAAFMIEGFRKGVYPPDPNSSEYKYDKKEILKWWSKNKNKALPAF
jgi:hypothetical protein